MPGRRAATAVAETEDANLSAYLTKKPTSLQARFPSWIKEEVGYDPAAAKTKDEAFCEGVRLATALRMVFQASDYNRQATQQERAERGTAPAPAKKAAAAAPKKSTRGTEPASAPAKKATPAGRRRSAAPKVDNEEVPF